MFILMYSSGEIVPGSSLRPLYKEAMSERRFAYKTGYEVPGFVIFRDDSGEVIFDVPRGRDTTLEMADVSVRTYNGLARKAKSLGYPWTYNSLTTGLIYEMAMNDQISNLPNAGSKTYTEIFQILYKYMGYNPILAKLEKEIQQAHKW